MTDLSDLLRNVMELKKSGLSEDQALTLRSEQEPPFAGHAEPAGYAFSLDMLQRKAARTLNEYTPQTHTISTYGSFATPPAQRRPIAGNKHYANLKKPTRPRIVINDEESYVIPDYPRLGPRP